LESYAGVVALARAVIWLRLLWLRLWAVPLVVTDAMFPSVSRLQLWVTLAELMVSRTLPLFPLALSVPRLADSMFPALFILHRPIDERHLLLAPNHRRIRQPGDQ
jgi:hypothetical protein